ncbi:hypothetical protein J2X69_004142 [Algoriphagus sp. 4150]|uniref:alpha-1,2-fucosyltransferase n=1 Tax=Algoriphagus sp. 4150 TaxID=2817756 RepID=UPI00285F8730|nr:alpha-1,2-fucosyltransferase [Algoriphagus sp. 4150]MDR7131777.1 hypothetical protein [Algoriphagus sp. 4150]
MNRVAIFGGLGNQMFQYALAIAMDAGGIPTKISVTDYLLNRHYQGFELLKAFNVPIPIEDRVRVFAINRVRPMLLDVKMSAVRTLVKKMLFKRKNLYKEIEEYSYDQGVFEQDSAFLVGTWQSINYFERQNDLIREVFNFNKPTDAVNMTIAGEILKKNAVAVHVRRGDYMNPEHADSRMVIDPLKYYNEAFHVMNESVENPVFYVFSDDVKWAKENFKGSNYVFLSHNIGANSYLDMYLMTLCKHFIIANSSFSWWGAWLAEYKEKKVIMPYPWVKNSSSEGIYPEGWIALKASSNKCELVH